MFEPITLPNARSEDPFKAALTLTINSGAEVANETTVIPMTTFGILSFKERATADFNNQFPPKINKNNPQKIKKKFIFFILSEDTSERFLNEIQILYFFLEFFYV